MRHQRGEGKLGCLASLLIMGVIVAAAIKAVPVYYGDRELADACDFIASAAAHKQIETLEREVKDKARELGVTEVLNDKRAIRITKSGIGDTGTCTITLHYKRVIDFYGVYKFTVTTDKVVSKPVFESI